MSNKDDNDECDNSANGCLSITTTTSTKNYDRIEVQKFKNQATSPNIPINEKEEVVKFEVFEILASKHIQSLTSVLFFRIDAAYWSSSDECDDTIAAATSSAAAATTAESRNTSLGALYSVQQ